MSSNIKITMLCQFCGEEFTARTTVTKFCSHKCASSAYKQKKRDEKIQKAQKNTEESKQVNLNNTIPDKEYLSVLDTAKLLGIGRATVNRYCVSGKIPCMKINRKIFIRRKDIERCFDNAAPYEVIPIVKEPVTEFYTIEEIEDKFSVSQSLIFKIVREKKIPKTNLNKKAYYNKKHIDRYFEQKSNETNISEWYSVEEMMEKFDMTKTAVYSFVSDNQIPRKQERGKAYYSQQHIDTLLSHKIPDSSIRDGIVCKTFSKNTDLSNLMYLT
ncbi:MAG: helix-turn-helix domain-containing protein [Prevotella sp.]|jgi:predicted DNA-binding transcriptional regulator AlpA|nr:helix-turn-helix domain-containing protein [Prevotella sp.]